MQTITIQFRFFPKNNTLLRELGNEVDDRTQAAVYAHRNKLVQ